MKIYFHLSLEGFTNSYVVTNPFTKEALIIDPGIITKEIINQIESERYTLKAILITHNHPGHVRGVATLKRIYNPVVYAADYDVDGNDTYVLNGDGTVKIAGFNVNYMALPGHTSDSLAYKIGRVIFTGDAITSGMIGTTSSNYADRILKTNIETKILSQHDDIILMPGHGPPSCVGAEKKFNLGVGEPEKSVRHLIHNL